MSNNNNSDESTATATSKKLNILIISSDMPSHVYACIKLGKVLSNEGSNHRVTIATPDGPSYECMVKEVADNRSHINVINAGTILTKKQINIRKVIDPTSWNALWQGLTNPLKVANQANVIKQYQAQGTFYNTILNLLLHHDWDIVIPIHSAVATTCDAIEVARKYHGINIPCLIFSSLPYDPCIMMPLSNKGMWKLPRSITALPHVSLYSVNSTLSNKETTFLEKLFNQIDECKKYLWKYLDYSLAKYAWSKSTHDNNLLRLERGLSPMNLGWKGYMSDGHYPVLTLGGIEPFEPMEGIQNIPKHVTAIGSLESSIDTTKVKDQNLLKWLQSTTNGVIYICFGTGTTFSNNEVLAITETLPTTLLKKFGPANTPKILFVLRPSEQERFKHLIESSMNSSSSSIRSISNYTTEYYEDGLLRIQDVVQQAALLQSSYVRVFVSHFGYGSFTEGVFGGNSMIAYPSGLDQYTNAQRAIDIGIAIQANYGLTNLSDVVINALQDEKLKQRCQNVSNSLQQKLSTKAVLNCIDRTINKVKQECCDNDACYNTSSAFIIP